MYPDFKVLIVEDNKDMRELLRMILSKKFQCNITQASDGQIALVMMENENIPDLVLLDLLMPVMNGRKFLQIIRENPKTNRLPVIIISAIDEKNAVLNVLEEGVTDYILKPINPKAVQDKVELFIKKKYNRFMEFKINSDGQGYFYSEPFPRDFTMKIISIEGPKYDTRYLFQVEDLETKEFKINDNPIIKLPKHEKPMKLSFKFENSKDKLIDVFFEIIPQN